MRSARPRLPASMVRRLLVLALMAGGVGLAGAADAQTSDLVSTTHFRVCADPANTPYSNREGTGFENKIAELIAADLGLPVQYEWFPMATGFVRRTLVENRCDVIIGYAQGHELVLNTNHYYTSAYVLVTKPDSDLAEVDALGDPRLKGHSIGIIAGSPPANHMALNGLIAKARSYKLIVDRRVESPAEEMIADLQAGEIDGAILWGPIGGYFGLKAGLTVTPLLKETLPPRLFFRITMGVRQGEVVWKRKLNSLLRNNQTEIDAILTEYGVPQIDEMGQGLKAVAK
jgi:quinoprotein dehydrogenase-associated probable ABC transporter substrate-binding protein